MGGGFGKVSIDENRIKMEKDGHRQLHRLSFLLFGLMDALYTSIWAVWMQCIKQGLDSRLQI